MKFNKKVGYCIILVVAILITYINIIPNQFVWDDDYFIVSNSYTKNLDNIPYFFLEPSVGNLYRPLRSVFYTFAFELWELNPVGYHLVGILLHVSITLMIFFLSYNIFKKELPSFVTALLFAVHPISTARITNMTASLDAFGILFLLIGLLFYIKSRAKEFNIYYFIISLVFFIIALLSSEEAITLPLLILLYEFTFRLKFNIKNLKNILVRLTPYFIVLMVYIIIRYLVLGQVGRTSIYFEYNFLGTILTTLKIFVQYVFILIYPFNLTIERVVKFETTLFSLTLIAYIILLSSLLFYFFRSYKRSKIIFFSIGWFLITLLPFTNIFPQVTIMADRYLYLAHFGFSLLLTYLIFSIKKIMAVKKQSNILIIIIILVLVVPYSFFTIKRNFEWRDEFTLLKKTYERDPFGTRTNNALANYYRENGDIDNAIKYATNAVELSDMNFHAYENLGSLYAIKQDYNKSIIYYKKALELNPNYYLALNNLGLIYGYLGNYEFALYYMQEAINENPRLSKAHHDIATIYALIGDFTKAEEEFKIAISINPNEQEYKDNYVRFLEYKQKYS